MDKRFLKEDGSMDIERIDNLPLEEYIAALESFTIAETSEYFDRASKIPIDENQGPVRMIYVDYDMDDERNGVEAHSFINELRIRNNQRKKRQKCIMNSYRIKEDKLPPKLEGTEKPLADLLERYFQTLKFLD